METPRRLALPGDAFQSRLLSADGRVADIDLDFEAAQAKCAEALKLDPKNADAHFVHGMMWLLSSVFTSRGQDDVRKCMSQAQEHMRQAAKLDSDYGRFADGFKDADAPDKYRVEGMGGNPYLPAVVQIEGATAGGSGWCVKSSTNVAYIVTNNHVIEGQTNLKVFYQLEAVGNLIKKTTQNIKILKTDPVNDLALLEVQTERQIKSLPLRQTAPPWKVPLPVQLIGSPGAGDVTLDSTVITGNIANWNRVVNNIRHLQLNANVDHGMSGGPVIDEKGEVVGVIKAIYADIKGQGLAILAEHVRDICKDAGIAVELRSE